MTRDRATLDDLEKRRRWAVKNLCSGKGYAMKAIVAYDMLVEDVPALLAVARAAESLVTNLEMMGQHPRTLQEALEALYAPKELVDMEEALK